jgi:hypothetical protein
VGPTATGAGSATAPSDAGQYTVKASFAGNTNYTAASDTKTVTVSQATPTVTASWTGWMYDGTAHAASATVSGVGSPAAVVSSPAPTFLYYVGPTATGAGSATAPSDAGQYTVKASFAGNTNYTAASDTKTVTISKATTSVTLAVASSPTQYSDTVSLNATITPKVAGSVQFRTFDGTTWTDIGAAVPVADGVGTASLTGYKVTNGPGTVQYKAVFTPTASNDYLGNEGTQSLTVTQEDALADYSGQLLVFASSTTATSASVPLQAVITDSPDGSRGEIKYATVDFLNTVTNTVLCSVKYSDAGTPGKQFLLDSSTPTAATVGCTATLAISGSSTDYTIGVRVGGYYVRPVQDDAIVTASLPITTQFITGGGYLKLGSASAGTYAGDAGSKTNFGFNVKYNNKGTNLQGHVNVIIRRQGKEYQAQGNNLGSLGVSYCKVTTTGTTCAAAPPTGCTTNATAACPIKATFLTQANLNDVTNPTATAVTVASGTTLQMTLTDNGEPGSTGPAPDTMAITITGKDGSLLYSSNWVGGTTVEQLLGGGNLVVH